MRHESTSPMFETHAPALAGRQRSTLINRNVTVAGRRTSIRLEPQMWEALHQICRREAKTLNELVTGVNDHRAASSLTAAIRVYLLSYYRAAATDEGHRLAGHGESPRQFPV